ncbi:FkbM family methyltransferase [Paracoccus benzoatiresistens]|uniref:FkbM family methyltransferase n=1 Tax=Paracoccus benzoatiresistens TaxID=2997341 RepID=A0ABT4JCY6_9RHOB|nr:FkbM family methyltransferase [Paracoccus sp. EF6]MCZ0964391.1 FkbM family methyltransferase [Paracoccus sp. EF6]
MRHEFFIHGVRVPITANEVSPVIWEALTSGRYEAKEARLVRRLVREGDCVLELGAGIGVITSVIASTPHVKVWSYDANPYTVSLAERVAKANNLDNVTFSHGLVTAGSSGNHLFYIRSDFWMSSLIAEQGPYVEVIETPSLDVDTIISKRDINVLVMDIEGAERQLLGSARLDGVDRVFLELHDHLYGLAGIRDIFHAMLLRNFSYDPRNSSGACIVFSRDLGAIRTYNPDDDL